jgi:ABC-type antimicrobial peptide transport system permease subunit
MRQIKHPLSPWIYFRRNPGRTIPVLFVIVVSVALVTSIATIITSIDLTVMTMYGYQKYFMVVTPRGTLTVPDSTKKAIHSNPMTGEVYSIRPAFTTVKTVFGRFPTVIFGLSSEGQKRVMERCRLIMVSGRLPTSGAPEVALSVEMARNKNLKLGDVVLKPEIEDSFSPIPARLVGTFNGPVWLAITSESFIQDNFPVAPQGFIVMSRDVAQQQVLDSSLEKAIPDIEARTWTYAKLVRDTRDALSNLYLIMSVVIGIIVFSIAFLTGMLSNIYFMQRLPEFATLAAIGYQRRGLLFRALGETALLCVIGWLLGSLLTIILLVGIREIIMEPRGLILNPFDLYAYRFTFPFPIAISAFALFAIWRHLRNLDPVSIIERRQ